MGQGRDRRLNAIEARPEALGEQLAQHDTKHDLTRFEKYRDNPVGFITKELGAQPWDRQNEIAEPVRDNKYVPVRTAWEKTGWQQG